MFEFLISTGASTISGCQAQANRTNRLSSALGGTFYVDETGARKRLESSINSQSLVEDSYTTQQSTFQTFYSSDGDLFFNTGVNNSNAFFQTGASFPVFGAAGKSVVQYDLFSSGESAIYSFADPNSISTGLQNQISVKGLNSGSNFSNLDLFVNGQKIYFGLEYFESGGSIIFDINFTGKIWAKEKQPFFASSTGQNRYFQGSFIEQNNNCYYIGMEQSKNSFLELYSGVDLVEKTKSSIVLFDEEEEGIIEL